ncbi:hypothetical protein CW748_14460 [Alteromonadales bacterium alter-6D02]|nr:hypothetical protein CW748_14460 [Alteromonadales bacterium alter-6D02]
MQRTLPIFGTKPTSHTIALCVLTCGLYVIYRLYTLTLQTNPHIKNPIATWFVVAAVVIHLLSFISLAYFILASGSQQLLLFSKVMHVISSISHLIWIGKLRNRIHRLLGAEKGSSAWLNPFLSTFLHVIYIQYKINLAVL